MAEVSTPHPSQQHLAAFAQGRLTPARAETVAKHLETCPDCIRAVGQVAGDSFCDLVRAAQPSGTQLHGVPLVAPPSGGKDLPPELANHSKFRIEKELGRGGMGVVYKAEHLMLGRSVAIKVITRGLSDHPDALKRFLQEVRAAGKLDHPHIVKALDADQAGNLHLLVMDFVDGLDLAEVLKKKGPLPILHACEYIRQAALGLQHAHEQGMIHRDIKPKNLMLTRKGQVKILDFGLASMTEKKGNKTKLTQVGSFMGTVEYMAPEQAEDATKADIRSDIYSLGCTLYCLLAGKPPFVRDTDVKIILAHLGEEARPLPEVRPDVPVKVSAVVAKMLAKESGQRYQTPVEVVQALREFCKPGANPVSVPTPAPVRTSDKGTVLAGEAARRTEVKPSAPLSPKAVTPGPGASPFQDLEADAAKPQTAKVQKTKENRPIVSRQAKWLIGGGFGVGVLVLAVVLTLVLTWKTPNGVVLLEIDQPGAEVFIDGLKMEVKVPGDAEPLRIEVVPDHPHELKVTKGGFQAFTKELTMQSGKAAQVRAKLVPDPIVAPPSAPPKEVPTAKPANTGVTPAVLVLHGHKAGVRQVLFTPDGSRLISGSYGNYVEKSGLKQAGPDNSVRVWNLESGKQFRHFDFTLPRVSGVQGLSVSPNGQFVAACTSWDRMYEWMCPWTYVWHIDTGERKHLFKLSNQVILPAVAFSGDGATLRVAHSGNQIVSWSLAHGTDLGAQDFDRETFPLEFSANGELLLGGDKSGRVWVWEARTGQKVTTLSGHVKPPVAAAVSKDGTRLLSSAEDYSIRLWEMASGKELTAVNGLDTPARCLALSPDGTRFVTGDDAGIVRLWDAATAKELARFTGHTGKVLTVAMSPDGKLAASGGVDTTIRLWPLP